MFFPNTQPHSTKAPASQYLNPILVIGEIGLVHSVGMSGIPVYAGSNFRDNSALYSRYVKKKISFSDYQSPKFIDELCELGETLQQKAVFLSDDDDAILAFSRHRERLSEYFSFLYPNAGIVEKVLDKQQFCSLSMNCGLPVPASFAISSRQELKNILPRLPFPCVIKPTNRSDWYDENFTQVMGGYKKAYLCNNKNELLDLYGRVSKINPRLVVQEYVKGEDDMHFELNMYVDRDGALKGYYIGQKPRIYPIGAGIGSYIKTVQDNEILEKGLSIVKELNLFGLLDFQFKRDAETGEAKLLEIHFRNTVWGFLGPAAGMNLYKMYYNDLTGLEELLPETYKLDVKYFKLERDIPAFLQYRSSGKIGFQEWINSYSGNYVIGGFSMKDPVAMAATIWFILKRVFRNKIWSKYF